MAQVFLSYLVLYGLSGNIIACSGAGALQFQREKMYPFFRFINTLLLVVGIVICSIVTFLLNKYVFSVYEIEYINITVLVLIAGLYNLFVSALWRKVSSFNHYLYENSFSYAFDLVFTVFVVLTLNMSLPIGNFMLTVLAVSIVVIVMNLIVGFFIKSLNRGYLNINVRNVSSRLFFLAIISLLLYYASMLVV